MIKAKNSSSIAKKDSYQTIRLSFREYLNLLFDDLLIKSKHSQFIT